MATSPNYPRSPLGRQAWLAGLLSLGMMTSAAQPPEEAPGDPARGKTLYTSTYKCYACHGYDGQTGERRLVPMSVPQEAFISFVQRSPLPLMPAYPDVPAADLADVYAYIRSIPVDAPALEDIPALKSILDEKRQALAE